MHLHVPCGTTGQMCDRYEYCTAVKSMKQRLKKHKGLLFGGNTMTFAGNIKLALLVYLLIMFKLLLPTYFDNVIDF